MQVTKAKLRTILVLALLLVCSFGCAPKYQPGGGTGSETGSVPELTDDVIRDRINGTRVHDIMPENGTGDPIPWGFDEDEPKEVTVIDKQINGTRATVVLDIKTQSSPRARNLRSLAGQIRTEWELETGLVTRRWEIERTENISMKYKDLPKPPVSNSNH